MAAVGEISSSSSMFSASELSRARRGKSVRSADPLAEAGALGTRPTTRSEHARSRVFESAGADSRQRLQRPPTAILSPDHNPAGDATRAALPFSICDVEVERFPASDPV